MTKIVEIIWQDSSYLKGWNDEHHVLKWIAKTEWIHSVGILTAKTKTHFVLTQNSGSERGNLIKIPKGCVKKVKTIGKLKIGE